MSSADPGSHQSTSSDIVTLVRTPAVIAGLVGVVAMVIGGIAAGGKGVLAAFLGAVVVVAFFAFGQLVVGRVLRNNPMLALNVALLVYLVQIAVLFVLLLVLRDATFFAPRIFAFTVLVCALTWIGAAVIGFSRSRTLYVEPGSGPSGYLPPANER